MIRAGKETRPRLGARARVDEPAPVIGDGELDDVGYEKDCRRSEER
jgi:hypothetical protein